MKEESTINKNDQNQVTDFSNLKLQAITNVTKQSGYFEINYQNGLTARLYILDSTTFRLYIDPTQKFQEPEQSEAGLHAQIFVKDIYDSCGMNGASIRVTNTGWQIDTGIIKINLNRNSATLDVTKNGKTIFQEAKPVELKDSLTVQTLVDCNSNYFGGGTQNGRFTLAGEKVEIVNTNNWVDQGVASPNPFYWSTAGYGVIRNTFKPGHYDFDSASNNKITTAHEEKRFDAVYFFADSAYELIRAYHQLTGRPALTPVFGFYEAHLNAYNRDYWVEVNSEEKGAIKYPDGKYYREYQPKDLPAELKPKSIRETLNGEHGGVSYQFSARAMLEQYLEHDMPIGWFLPNDGYGAGYGQTDTLAGNLKNLAEFVKFANSKGVQVGLWTQQNLAPVDPENPKPDDRDFEKELVAGVTALKTDEAWVGHGYSFGLNATQSTAKMIAKIKGDQLRPFIITVDGWAGTQNTSTVWTGDEVGGEWEYIRFQIPTYIGEGLSGQPNVASDMDGIFGGQNPIVNTRDYQWKAFTPIQLNMDGWGKNPKNPFAFGGTTTKLNRAYLKQKSMLLPYIYSIAAQATFTSKPMVRAMFLEYPNVPEFYTNLVRYQYLWGDNFLVAPIYQNTASDEKGNDVRNEIYLPDKKQIWIDYFTGQEYQGGQVINNFAAPLWKLPVFVKAGAIIPVASATNTPQEYFNLKKMRQFVIYPSGTSNFNVYEDDGFSAQYKQDRYVQTKISSSLRGSSLTVKINKAQGTYAKFDPEKTTELNIKTAKVPRTIAVLIGNKEVDLTAAENLADFQKHDNCYYFDQHYLTNPYLAEFGSNLEQTFLRIKLQQTNVCQNEITVEITGSASTAVPVNELPLKNEALIVPANLTQNDQKTTSNSITVSWQPVPSCDSYQLKIDGLLYSNIKKTAFTFSNLKPDTTHTFQVREIKELTASSWGAKIICKTKKAVSSKKK